MSLSLTPHSYDKLKYSEKYIRDQIQKFNLTWVANITKLLTKVHQYKLHIVQYPVMRQEQEVWIKRTDIMQE